MSTTKNKQAVIVGIFILIGIIIFIAGVLTLGGQKRTFSRTIPIKAIFGDVSGLQAGNNVWIAGVKVGTVKSVKLAGDAAVEVIMNIEEQVLSHIKKDAKAKIGSDGLIGNRIVVIYGGSPATAAVTRGDVLQVDKPLSTDQMLATLQQNNQNLLDITSHLKTVSQKIAGGEGTLGQLINDETLGRNLQSTVKLLERSSANVQGVTTDLAGWSNQLQQKGSLAHELVNDTLVFANLRASVAQIQEVSKSATTIMDNFNQASKQLHSSNNAVGLLLNNEDAADNLKQTLQNLQSSTEKLNENMEALQHSFLLRGYFKRKEKYASKAGE